MDTKDTKINEANKIAENIKKVIIGKNRAIELAVVALVCQGHILIEDVPGVGKTMLARSLAKSTGCSYSRIQFTPDLLPSDITGVSIYNQKEGDFEFKSGPVISQLVLADEINRATPKTQSALLESMDERQVTVEGVTHVLPRPFMVMATQNPIEYEGTFPLPEAQLDRFFLKISLGYPSLAEEESILSSQENTHPIELIEAVVSSDEIVKIQDAVKTIYVDDSCVLAHFNLARLYRLAGNQQSAVREYRNTVRKLQLFSEDEEIKFSGGFSARLIDEICHQKLKQLEEDTSQSEIQT